MEQRRRAPRAPADNWPGRCTIEGDPESDRFECVVVDLSLVGAGLEMNGETHGDLVGRRLEITVQPPMGASVTLRLVGPARYVEPAGPGRTRVGIEFVDLSETERNILRVFELMKVFW